MMWRTHVLDRSRQLGYLLCLGLIVAMLVPGLPLGGPAPASAHPYTDYCADPEEAAFLGLLNQYRASQGKGPLLLNAMLSGAADHHSISMADNNYFDHYLIPESTEWFDNIANHGYTSWRISGENIAAGNDTATAVLDQWKRSSTHNTNMLDGQWTNIGIGRAYKAGTRYGWYWTTTFGTTSNGGLAPTCGGTTPTPTSTAIPATATATSVPSTSTPTSTPVPPTMTSTSTPFLPTATKTPPPASATATSTLMPPTSSATSVPKTATSTPAPSTSTGTSVPSTSTSTPAPSTPTSTALASSATPTSTSVPATATATSFATATVTQTGVPPSATSSAVPTATATSTRTASPTSTVAPSATLTRTPLPTATSVDTPAPTVTEVPTSTATAVAIATATTPPSAAATATPLPPATATLTTPAQRPSVTLSKDKSKFNGLVEANLSGFAPGAAITLSWPGGTVVANAMADGAGNATATFRTPLVAFGTYRVEAWDAAGRTATDTLSVIPRIMLNEEAGSTSTRLRVYFYGFAPGERVEVRWYTAGESSYTVVKTIVIASNGRGSSIVEIPTRTGVGERKVMGRVIGVARSASTTFRVSAGRSSAAAVAEPSTTATSTLTATPAATAVPVEASPTPIVTLTPAIDEATPAPTVTAVPSPAPTSIPTPMPDPAVSPSPDSTADATPTPAPTELPTATPQVEEPAVEPVEETPAP